MLAQVVRSGVIEAVHDGSIVAARADGTEVASDGDIDRRFLIRSSAKPFQAMVAVRHGADLAPEQLAVAAASHGGQPIHVAYVRSMLAEVGLDTTALQTPPAWPMVEAARSRLERVGHRFPKPEYHNCSGKHTAMLRACVAQGWPVETYLDPDHPLQLANRAEFEKMTGEPAGDPAVDGCGAPVFPVSTRGLATAYARFGTSQEYREVWWAMHRFASLTSDWGEIPAAVAHWVDVAAKSGAEGVIGVATRADLGIAIKCWDGSHRPVGPALLAALDQLGLTPRLTRPSLAERLSVDVLGGVRPVGRVEPLVRLG